MAREQRRLRALSLVLLVWGIALVGCNRATLTAAPDCTGNGCTCEEEPSQPTCAGFNGGDAVRIKADANGPIEPDAGDDAADAAEGGASEDGGDRV